MSRRIPPRRERWSTLEKMILFKAHKAGKTPTEIYRAGCLSHPERSWNAIVRMWWTLGLAQKQSKPKIHNKIWTDQEKRQFDEYLHRYSFSETPEQIANYCQIHVNTVIKWQQRLNVRPTRKQVMAMQFSQEKQKHSRRRQRRAMLLKTATWKQRKYRRLVELAETLRRRENPPDEQTCRCCGTVWPKWKEFFRFNEYHTKMGTQRWYRTNCVLCEYEKRAAKKQKATG